MMQKRGSLSSAESAKRFLASVQLRGNAIDSLVHHPNTSLFPVALSARLQSWVRSAFDKNVAEDAEAAAPAPFPSQQPAGLKGKTQQDYVVGNEIISFNDEVTADRKAAAINSTLLAQLWASHQYADRTKPNYATNWFGAYLNTLVNIGWMVQGDIEIHEFTGTREGTVDSEVITLTAAIVGATSAAAVKAVFSTLKNLGPNNPIVTIFKETAQHSSVAQFSVSLSSQDSRTGFLMDNLELGLLAEATDTRVLFFEWNSEEVKLNWRNLQLSIADDVFKHVADEVAKKVQAYLTAYVHEIQFSSPRQQENVNLSRAEERDD